MLIFTSAIRYLRDRSPYAKCGVAGNQKILVLRK
jgi:hypothetical protein